MAFLVEIALSNVLVAGLLAILAASVGWWGRRPALTHALWLLVLLKLITPPVFECAIPWPESPPPPEAVAQVKPVVEIAEMIAPLENLEVATLPPLEVNEPSMLPANPQAEEFAKAEPEDEAPIGVLPVAVAKPPVAILPIEVEKWQGWRWSDLALALWLTGSGVWLMLALRRLWRFQRMLRFAEPAPEAVQALARRLADGLGVRCPDIDTIPGNVSPMLWALGRTPRLLLPAGLVERLSENQLATLLVHEMAHWKRRDDRVRWLELVVLCLYWWCPLAWWARRELHQAEEECCDAWVVSVLPESAKDYALALVETVDFLCAAPAPLPPLASGLGRVRLLKRRLTMILQGKTPRALTFTGLLAVAGVGLLMLPLVFARSQNVQIAAQQDKRQPDGKKGGGGRPDDFGDPRAEIQRLQEEIHARQQELQLGMKQLQGMMQRLEQIQGNRGGQGGQGQQGGQGGQGGPRGPDGQNQQGGPNDVPRGKGQKGGPGLPGQPGGERGPNDGPGGKGKKGGPGQPGQPGGGPGFPGGGNQPGFPGPGFPGPGGPLDQRLQEVERKLDMLLNEVRQLRNEARPGSKGPRPDSGFRPTPKSPPSPRPNTPGGSPTPLPGGNVNPPNPPAAPPPPNPGRNEGPKS